MSDKIFVVTVDGINAQFNEIKTDDYRNMAISFPSGADKISIIGTSVVPEFGTIAMMILVISIVSIVAISAKSKLSLKL